VCLEIGGVQESRSPGEGRAKATAEPKHHFTQKFLEGESVTCRGQCQNFPWPSDLSAICQGDSSYQRTWGQTART